MGCAETERGTVEWVWDVERLRCAVEVERTMRVGVERCGCEERVVEIQA